MKRVLAHTPPWLVVPVSVLGASLLLAVAHWGLKPNNPPHLASNTRTSQPSLSENGHEPRLSGLTYRLPADCETPPVTRYSSVTAYGDPSSRLLPRTESESVDMAETSDVVPNHEGASSPRYLASSDAVPVLASVDWHEQVNTGWLPTNSSEPVLVRPVPLLLVAGQPLQARYANPLPRYGSRIQGFEEMPLVAPVEQTAERAEPAERTAVNLVDEMFAPPLMKRETLEPIERSEVGLVAPILAVPDVMVPLPPVERVVEGGAELAPAGPAGGAMGALDESASEMSPPLLPVESDLADEFEMADAGVVDAPRSLDEIPGDLLVPLPPVEPRPGEAETADAGVAADESGTEGEIPGDLLVPLPPVEPRPSELVVGKAELTVVPLPPVEPRSLTSGEPRAMLMIEGLFEPMAAEPRIGLDLGKGKDSGPGGEDFRVSDGPIEEGALAGTGDESDVLQPLPPVERDAEASDVSKSDGADGTVEAEEKGRSWELELIAQEADEHSRRGFELAGKKAHFAARLEFTRALRIVAQGLDTEHKTNRHSLALAAGLRALTEAEDFLPKDGHFEAELDLAVITGAHRTPVLHECDVHQMTPLVAIQKYHTFAQEQMAVAVGNEVAGSMALCGLGKLYVVIGDQQRGNEIAAARTKAMVLLQAALIASPANHMASNELGVLFARNGRHAEARAAFQHSVAMHGTAEGWRNLALTCERLGEMDVAYRAAQQSLALRDGASGKTPVVKDASIGTIRWVSPGELADTGGTVRTASTAGGADRAR